MGTVFTTLLMNLFHLIEVLLKLFKSDFFITYSRMTTTTLLPECVTHLPDQVSHASKFILHHLLVELLGLILFVIFIKSVEGIMRLGRSIPATIVVLLLLLGRPTSCLDVNLPLDSSSFLALLA